MARSRRQRGDAVTNSMPSIVSRADALRAAIDATLADRPEVETGASRLADASRHALLGGGKRIRGILCVLTARAAGAEDQRPALSAAAAVEMVHAASLVLDDLPAMDDANVRRGKPTTHIAFGEASAILAAINLLNGAYDCLATAPFAQPVDAVAATGHLARAVGPLGLCGGQMRDLAARTRPHAGLAEVEETHAGKTGALFAASLAMGGTVAGLDAATQSALWRAGMNIGVAFQGYDDLLDRHAAAAAVGKPTGTDAAIPTVASLLPLAEAQRWCEARLARANDALAHSGFADTVLTDYVAHLADILSAPLFAASERST